MNTIGSRITEERERLGLNLTDFASLMGYSSYIQGSYERNETIPESMYLQEIIKHGGDMLYIITGNRECPIQLSTDEQVLVDNYRAMNEASRLKIPSIGNSAAYKRLDKRIRYKYLQSQ